MSYILKVPYLTKLLKYMLPCSNPFISTIPFKFLNNLMKQILSPFSGGGTWHTTITEGVRKRTRAFWNQSQGSRPYWHTEEWGQAAGRVVQISLEEAAGLNGQTQQANKREGKTCAFKVWLKALTLAERNKDWSQGKWANNRIWVWKGIGFNYCQRDAKKRLCLDLEAWTVLQFKYSPSCVKMITEAGRKTWWLPSWSKA